MYICTYYFGGMPWLIWFVWALPSCEGREGSEKFKMMSQAGFKSATFHTSLKANPVT